MKVKVKRFSTQLSLLPSASPPIVFNDCNALEGTNWSEPDNRRLIDITARNLFENKVKIDLFAFIIGLGSARKGSFSSAVI